MKTFPTSQTASWKSLYKIQSNWSIGNAKSSALDLRRIELPLPPITSALESEEDVKPILPLHQYEEEKPYTDEEVSNAPQTIVTFHDHFVLTASRCHHRTESIPLVHVHLTKSNGTSTRISQLLPQRLINWWADRPGLLERVKLSITSMRLDESVPITSDGRRRLIVFYSSGQFSIFSLYFYGNESSPEFQWQEDYTHLALPTLPIENDPTFNVVETKFSFPMVMTCTSTFVIGFWMINQVESNEYKVTLHQPMRSSSCWSPVVLSLESVPIKTEDKFQNFHATVAYSTPYFPSSWSVAIQKFDITLTPSTPSKAIIRAFQCTAQPPLRTSLSPSHSRTPRHFSRIKFSLVSHFEVG